jgi:hypothetical protein
MSSQRHGVAVASASVPGLADVPPVPLGLADGILPTLMLASHPVTSGSAPLASCLQIALPALGWNFVSVLLMRSGVFRGTVVQGSPHGSPHHFRRSAVDEWLRRGVGSALLAGASGFLGALLPLGLAGLFTERHWLVLGLSLLLSSAMGIPLARSMRDSVVRWVLWLALAGCAMAALGRWLAGSERAATVSEDAARFIVVVAESSRLC